MEDFPHPFPPARPTPGSLWKLLRAGMVHNGHEYRPGRIQLLPHGEPFVPNFKTSRGGFYLAPFEAIPRWLQIYDDLEFIAPARLGRTSRVIRAPTRIKTDCFFLGYPQFLWKFIQDFLNPFEVVMRSPYNIRFYQHPNIVQMEDAVTADPHTLQYIYPQPIGVSIMAVKKNGLALRHMRHKDVPEVCLAAVEQNGLALAYLNKQTSKFQHIRAVDLDPILIAAVNQNGMALGYVKDKIPQLCEMAVQRSPMALMYVPEENKTKELCLRAYRGNPETIRYIPDALKGEIVGEGKYEAFSKTFVLH